MVSEQEQIVQNQDNVSISSEPSVVSNPTETKNSEIKQFSQERLNKIMGGVRQEGKQEGYEQGKREALSELQAIRQEAPAPIAPQQGNASVSREDVQRLIREEAERQVQMAKAQEIAQSFVNKLSSAKQTYSDFEQQVSKLKLEKNLHLVELTHALDNPGEVLYDLATNPKKFADIQVYAASETPDLAIEELQKLSASIKQNKEALKQNAKQAQEPIGQLKPSVTGVDSGQLSLKDYKNQSWARG
jgi:hypothetical protein